MGERRGTRGLELWCKRMTEGYPGVKVENMTTSWRDGLAFCAIIHHFRPDLIDFSKLNKEDIYNNNNLAFRIAEDHLGIPALLEPEDMVEYPVPDRLSILTYLSQFYQAFAVNSSSTTKVPAKRPPPAELQRHMVTATGSSPPKKAARGVLGARREPCAKCGLPVFIAERLNVGKALYHRTCFRCARCDTQLTLDNNYQSENDEFCCKTCPDKAKASTSPETNIMNRSLSDEEKSASLKGEPDPFSADFENVLEDTKDDSLKRNFTLDRMLGTALQKARSDFMTTQMTSFDSDVETDSEDKPPDLPVSEKPQLDVDSDEPSENIDVFSNNLLPSLSDNFSVDSDQKQCNPEDPVTKDSISTKATSIKPSIRTRMKIFEASVESCKKSDVNKESPENSEKVVLVSRVESPQESCENEEQSSPDIFHSNLSINVSEIEVEEESSIDNSISLDPNNSQAPSSIFSGSSINNANEEVIVLSSESSSNENSVIIISDTSEDSKLQTDFPPSENTDHSDECSQQPTPVIIYPTDLNPFGDDDEEMENETPFAESTENINSASLNPFGDTDEEDDEPSRETVNKSLNPFGSDEDDAEEEIGKSLPPQPMIRKLKAPKISLTLHSEEDDSVKHQEQPISSREEDVKYEEKTVKLSPIPLLRKLKAPRISLTPLGDQEPRPLTSSEGISASPRASLHGSGRKKKPAPKPPIQELEYSPYSSLSSTTSHKLSQSTKEPPRSRKTRRAPLPPASTPIKSSESSLYSDVSPIGKKMNTVGDAFINKIGSQENLKMSKDESRHVKHVQGSSSVPKKLTLKEIEQDLVLVETQMRGLEKNGVILEKIIREKSEKPGASPDDALSPEVDDMILELFELINEKCELFRKQTELMYLRRQHRLEREHKEIENQLRCLMLQPDAHKTDSDKAKEEELLNKMLEIVERRNEIVDRLEYDRRREVEEDISIRSHMSLYSMKREAGHSLSKKATKKEKHKVEKDKKLKKNKGDNRDESKLTLKDKKKKKVLNLF